MTSPVVNEISGPAKSVTINSEWWVLLDPKMEVGGQVYYEVSGVSTDCEKYIDVLGLHTEESAINWVNAVLTLRGRKNNAA